jgi:hypothetical protein
MHHKIIFHYIGGKNIPRLDTIPPPDFIDMIGKSIINDFRSEMTIPEMSLWDKAKQSPENLNAVELRELDSLLDEFDRFILFSAANIGWYLVLTDIAKQRMSAWAGTTGGYEKFVALGRRMALASLRFRLRFQR